MKTILIIILSLYILQAHSQVGINNTNPHASSILDMTSSTKGLHIPRMTLAQRNAINSPALGLTIYQTNGTVGFYYYTGSNWRKIDVTTNLIADNDLDTKIDVEKNPDEDIIRFDIGGTEIITLHKNSNNNFRWNSNSALNNTYFGISSGSTNTVGTNNTAIGDSTLRLATTSNNTAIGLRNLSAMTLGSNNTAVGIRALQAVITGGRNTGVGNGALMNNLGSDNTTIGLASMKNNSAGSNNVGIGLMTLQSNTFGNQNVAIGSKVLSSNTTGINNTAIGYHALQNGNGSNNTAVGNYALQNFTSGNHNTAIGFNALKSFTNGSFNTAVGAYALEDLTSGSSNTAAGTFSLKNVTTGSHNTALGNGALSQGTILNYNSAIGTYALLNSNNAQYNTAIGYEALRSNTSGNNNTAVGYQSLYTNTTGSNNTGIGYLANVGTNNLTNATAIGARSIANKSNALILGAVEGENGAISSSRVTLNYFDIRDNTVVDLFGYFRGLFIPRMTTTQMNAINNPANGLMIYNLTTHSPWFYNGQLWEDYNLDIGHLGANDGEGLIHDGENFIPGFTPLILSEDGNSKVDVNATASFDNGGTTRVVLNNNEVFKLETNLPDYNSSLSIDADGLCLFLGENTGLDYQVGTYNTGIGTSALRMHLQGDNNIAVGSFAMRNGQYNGDNIAIGNNALFSSDGGIGNNIAIGNAALYNDATPDSCIAIGYHTLNTYTNKARNIGIGAYAEIDGNNSIALGARAKVVGDNNIVLGSINGVNGATADTKVGIGDSSPEGMLHLRNFLGTLLLEDNASSNIRMRFGVVGGQDWEIVSTASASEASAKMDFEIGSDPYVMSIIGNGNVNVFGNFTDASDIRLKKDITSLISSLKKIKNLNGYHYYWKDKHKSSQLQTGVIAQEVIKEFPELVKEDEKILNVNYNGLTATLLDAIKEMKENVEDQKKQIDFIQYELSKLKVN